MAFHPKPSEQHNGKNYTILIHWKMTKVPITANSKTSLESHSVNRRGNESRIAFPRLHRPFFLSDMLSDKERRKSLWVKSRTLSPVESLSFLHSTLDSFSRSLWISWKKSTPTEKKENEGIIIKRYMRFCTQQTTIFQDEECAQSQQILQLFSLENFHPKSIHSSLWWTSSSSSQKSKEREKHTEKKTRNVQFLQETTAAWKWILSLHETDLFISRPSSFRVSFSTQQNS